MAEIGARARWCRVGAGAAVRGCNFDIVADAEVADEPEPVAVAGSVGLVAGRQNEACCCRSRKMGRCNADRTNHRRSQRRCLRRSRVSGAVDKTGAQIDDIAAGVDIGAEVGTVAEGQPVVVPGVLVADGHRWLGNCFVLQN